MFVNTRVANPVATGFMTDGGFVCGILLFVCWVLCVWGEGSGYSEHDLTNESLFDSA